jgi:O-6-methylguanine DNA methyltransferase
MTQLEFKILELVKQIPQGKVTTYSILARKLGKKGLARMVGNTLNKNPQLFTIPCHRVVRNDQKVGHYRLGVAKKIKLLQNEGISIKEDKIANFTSYLYKF